MLLMVLIPSLLFICCMKSYQSCFKILSNTTSTLEFLCSFHISLEELQTQRFWQHKLQQSVCSYGACKPKALAWVSLSHGHDSLQCLSSISIPSGSYDPSLWALLCEIQPTRIMSRIWGGGLSGNKPLDMLFWRCQKLLLWWIWWFGRYRRYHCNFPLQDFITTNSAFFFFLKLWALKRKKKYWANFHRQGRLLNSQRKLQATAHPDACSVSSS